MPQFHGIPFVWRTPDCLAVGDELLLSNGDQVFVTEVYDDRHNGIWLTLSDGNDGYATGRWRVIV